MPRRAVRRVTRPREPDRMGVSARALVVPELPASTLDSVIHERMRLAIASALALNPTLTFTELKRMFEMTDGNLSIHARRLEEVGYIASTKSVEGRTPKTEFALTPAGRRALDRYLDQMEAIIRAARGK